MRVAYYLEPLEVRMLLSGGGGDDALTPLRFAVIGDYGDAGPAEEDVADLVKSWDPDLVLTVGDNNYPDGEASTIDANIGQYYHEFIYNYTGTYGPGSPTRRFLPSLGNHDWNTPGAQPYLDYFDLPGNERYYEFASGAARFFMVDSDPAEPDGVTATSAQAQWLQSRLAAATEPFKLVILHHPPYSSSSHHGSTAYAQWPFTQWGATAVMAGHDHTYERLNVGGLPYFVNGLGGRPSIYDFGPPLPGSEARFNADHGAMLGEIDGERLRLRFFTRAGAQVDQYTIPATGAPLPTINVTATDGAAAEAGRDPAVFTITRTGDASGPLTVDLLIGGDATNGADYLSIPASVTFADGQASATVTIRPIDDQLVESRELVTLALAPRDHYNTGASPHAEAALADNDAFDKTYVARGASWRFLDDGSDQGTAWRAPAFTDSTWDAGPAQLGYGDGDEATVIDGGPSGARFITHYFRRAFDVADPARVMHLVLSLVRDDGAVIWLNGQEAWRSNMPAGPVTWQTPAASNVGGDDEHATFARVIDPALLVAGTNVIAVELHQSGPTTNDASFDLSLVAVTDAVAPPALSRPDLDASSDTGIRDDDDLTRDATPTFTGTAEPHATVTLYAGAAVVGSAVASYEGAWSITATELDDGQHVITARATDSAGNPSALSPPLVVRIDTRAPTMIGMNFGYDLAPMAIAMLFSEPVDPTLSVADLLLRNVTTGTDVEPANLALLFGDATVWWRFPGFARGILPDADYRATVLAAGVTDAAGNALSADAVLDFFFLNADANRDRAVNLLDFNILAGNFGQSNRPFSRGDFNYDGQVNLDDFNVLAAQFGRVPLPGVASRGEDRERLDDPLDDLLG